MFYRKLYTISKFSKFLFHILLAGMQHISKLLDILSSTVCVHLLISSNLEIQILKPNLSNFNELNKHPEDAVSMQNVSSVHQMTSQAFLKYKKGQFNTTICSYCSIKLCVVL